MKNSQLFKMVLLIGVITAACHKHNRKTIIASNSDYVSKKVEYTGWISFNADKTAIQRMSPRAYLKYDYNNEELMVTSDSKGNFTYEQGDGSKSTQLTNENKHLLLDAIKLITSQQHKQKRNNSY